MVGCSVKGAASSLEAAPLTLQPSIDRFLSWILMGLFLLFLLLVLIVGYTYYYYSLAVAASLLQPAALRLHLRGCSLAIAASRLQPGGCPYEAAASQVQLQGCNKRNNQQ